MLHQLVFPVLLLKGAVEKDLYQAWFMATNSQIFCFQWLCSWSLMEGRQLSLWGRRSYASIDACDLSGRLTLHLPALREIRDPFFAALRHSCSLAGLCPWCSLPRLCLFCVTFGAGRMLRMCPQVAIELQRAVTLCQQIWPGSVPWSPCFISLLNLLGELLRSYEVWFSLFWDACLSEGRCCVTNSSVHEGRYCW